MLKATGRTRAAFARTVGASVGGGPVSAPFPALALPSLVLGDSGPRFGGGAPVAFWQADPDSAARREALLSAPASPRTRRRVSRPRVVGDAANLAAVDATLTAADVAEIDALVQDGVALLDGMESERHGHDCAAVAPLTRQVLRLLAALEEPASRSAAAREVMQCPRVAGAVLDPDGVRLAHRAVQLDPAAALAACRTPRLATLADHAGRSVAHAAVSFHEVAAQYVLGIGGGIARLADGTGWTVAHAAMHHRNCGLLILGMPMLAQIVDSQGWSVLHEAVLHHPAVGQLAIGSGSALARDGRGVSAAELAVLSSESSARLVLQGGGVHPEVRSAMTKRGVTLSALAEMAFPFALEDARRERAVSSRARRTS